MITTKEWLTNNFPDLVADDGGISGRVTVRASYNHKNKSFKILEEIGHEDGDEIVIQENFDIEIKNRPDSITSVLPALIVKGIETIPDRHFNQSDKSACLCSPLEEDEFIYPDFALQKFMIKLVVPFLYAQAYYTKYGKWPWFGYSHGAIGVLESYLKINVSTKAQECIKVLSRDRVMWSNIKNLLLNKSKIKGHTLCICVKRDHSRRCHPDAMAGLSQLIKDIQNQKISIKM